MNLPFLKSPHGEDPIILEAEFSVPIARLFKAWTTPEDIKQWFGASEGGPKSAAIELHEGGKWEFIFPEQDGQVDSLSGRYLRIEDNKHLEFTWVHTRKKADGNIETSGESVVTVEFEERPTGTFSRLVHKTVTTEGSRSNIGSGWGMSFTKMKHLLE